MICANCFWHWVLKNACVEAIYFSKNGVAEILNLQPKSKAYQVKQVRNLLIAYKLTGIDDE